MRSVTRRPLPGGPPWGDRFVAAALAVAVAIALAAGAGEGSVAASAGPATCAAPRA